MTSRTLSRALSRALSRSLSGSGSSVLTPAAPVFTLQPTNQSAIEGQDVVFASRASGYPTPTYQWYVDDGGGFNVIVDATGPVLILTSVTISMTGYIYRCTASNTEGSTNSDSATLDVIVVNNASGARSFFGWFFGGFGGGA